MSSLAPLPQLAANMFIMGYMRFIAVRLFKLHNQKIVDAPLTLIVRYSCNLVRNIFA
jgi:hypothetical protein